MGMLDILTGRQPSGVLRFLGSPGAAPFPEPAARPQVGTRVNPILEAPGFADSLTRTGLNMMAASAQPGATVLGSLGLAGAEALKARDEQQLRAAQIEALTAKTRAEQRYGVQSQGFEGDIARAMTILNDEAATERDKAIARSVLDTASRLVPQFNSTTGAFQNVPKAVLPGGSPYRSSEAAGAAENLDGPLPSVGADPGPVQPLLLPPPTSGSFAETPAAEKARYEKELQLELAKEKQNLEQQGAADTSAANAEQMLSELRDGKAALENFQTGLFAPIRGKVAQARAEFGDEGAEAEAQAFETINRVSKKLGAEGLKAFGGSDTERELAVAIETSVDSANRPETNRKIFEKQLAAMEILAQRPAFLARYGGDGSSEEFKKAWREFQKAEFAKGSGKAVKKVLRYNAATGRLE